MKKIIIFACGIFIVGSLPSLAVVVNPQKGEIEEIRNYDEKRQMIIKIIEKTIDGTDSSIEKNNRMALHTCMSEEAGIRFACNPNWKLSRQGKMMTIQISFGSDR